MSIDFKSMAQEERESYRLWQNENYERQQIEKREERRYAPAFDGVCVGAANEEDMRIIDYLKGISRKDLALSFIEQQIRPKYAQLYVDVPISESYRMYNPGCGCAFCEGVYALLKERFLDPDLRDLKEEQEIATMEDPSYEEEDCEKTKEIRFEFTDKGFDQIKALIRILVEELKNNKK